MYLASVVNLRYCLRFLLPATLLLPASQIKGQQGEPTIEAVVDSLWNHLYDAPDSVQREARKLLVRAQHDRSVHGILNGWQLIGESYYYRNELDSSTHYYRIALAEAQRAGDQREEAHTFTALGSLASDQGLRDSALVRFDRALALFAALRDTSQLCGVAVRVAGACDRFDLDELAMRHFVDALRYCKQAGDEAFVAHALNGIGILHKKQRNYPKALAMLDSARVIYDRIGDRFGAGGVLNNLGVVYKSMGRYTDARRCYDAGLALFEADDYSRGIMSFNQNLGVLDNLEGKPEAGLLHCTTSLRIARESSLVQTQSEALNEIARSLMLLGREAAALESVDRAIALAEQAKLPDKEQQAWGTRSDILVRMGRSAEALTAYKRQQVLRDSVFTLEKAAELDRLQTLYEAEQREATIAHLTAQAALDEARRRWLLIGLIAIGVAAVTIVLALVQRRRRERELLHAQVRLRDAENQRLQDQLDHKRRELTDKALHLAQKNELLRALEQELSGLRDNASDKDLAGIASRLRFDQQIDQNWEQFTLAFTETRGDFFKQLAQRHPDLTPNEVRLAALLSMNLGNKELGTVLNISDEGVKKARYRLRKKLELRTEDGLEQYLAAI